MPTSTTTYSYTDSDEIICPFFAVSESPVIITLLFLYYSRTPKVPCLEFP